jgi:hypothetical protein
MDLSFANSVSIKKDFEMRENIKSLCKAIYVPAKNNLMDLNRNVQIYT